MFKAILVGFLKENFSISALLLSFSFLIKVTNSDSYLNINFVINFKMAFTAISL
jgi:hypothetical protein